MKFSINKSSSKLVQILIVAEVILTSCKKLVEINPPVTQITAASTYSNNVSAASVMTGVYSNMMSNQFLSDVAIVLVTYRDWQRMNCRIFRISYYIINFIKMH